MRFEDVKAGRCFRIGERIFVKLHPFCEFVQSLPKPHFYAVQIKTGVLTCIGPDTEIEPLVDDWLLALSARIIDTERLKAENELLQKENEKLVFELGCWGADITHTTAKE